MSFLKNLIKGTFAACILLGGLSQISGDASAAAESAAETNAGPVALNPDVTIRGAIVRLGDLFAISGEQALTPLFRAPNPGRTLVLDTRDLVDLARTHKIAWTPLLGDESTIIRRASVLVSRVEIEDALARAIGAPEGGGAFEVALSGRMPGLYIPAEDAGSIAIEELHYDPHGGRFSAVVVAPASAPRAARVRVAGRLHATRSIPIPVRGIGTGEIITMDDLALETRRMTRREHAMVTEFEGLIGKAAQRPLRAGEPVRARDVAAPQLVSRGRAVTMVYRAPGLILTALGTAVENGAAGEAVRVVNSQSKMVIQAVVAGPDTVVVPHSAIIGAQ